MNAKTQDKRILDDKIEELTNQLENKTKLIEEVNKIILKNNSYFEQTNMELSSNKKKIDELNTLYANIKEELNLKEKQLYVTNEELILARNNYIIKQSK